MDTEDEFFTKEVPEYKEKLEKFNEDDSEDKKLWVWFSKLILDHKAYSEADDKI